MEMYTGKKIGSLYRGYESVIVYRAGQSVFIDRTVGARSRCIGSGMTPRYKVTADTGEAFTVYAGNVRSCLGCLVDSACAIPD